MERLIYSIILAYFILGGIGFYLINRNKAPEIARKSYTKFGVYFIIINVIFFSMTIQPLLFSVLTFIIMWVGFMELFNLLGKSGFKHIPFFILSLTVYSAFSFCFLFFWMLRKELTLFTFLILSIFDSFSQISGQLVGRTKILPQVSPGKTWEGLAGGTLVAITGAFLLKGLYEEGSTPELFIFTLGTLFFAFTGDTLASLFKRKYKVKDYSKLIPGHGGFLDRFDSLIAGGAWAALTIPVLGI
jgi:phosphatidate cytidylyltransferase